ncbi:hypothetical protein H4582DRAFT_1895709 [Lactarius indigo]|nr:hypothetical protein H4582DRAFT_1895709 [Lactarius indigo]
MSMMLTRSAARALLTNRPDYETFWSSRDGWLKLAHVCLHWRRVVLLSSSRRLHVHLLFTPRRSPTDPMLKCLPPLPISEENFALATIKHRSRVRRVALRRPYTEQHMGRLLKALSHPFPELESSAPSLRQLTLREVIWSCSPSFLSSATGLVELSLTLRVAHNAVPEASFIANLQRMSRLRRLELELKIPNEIPINDDPPLPTGAGNIIPLQELTQLVFIGRRPYLEALVAVLAAPSLQRLDVELGINGAADDRANGLPIPHLCRFIRDTDNQFITVRLDISHFPFKFSAGTGSQSVHDQPFVIVNYNPVPLELLGRELSGPLSTVEELIIGWEPLVNRYFQLDQIRGFYYYLPQVKIVQVPAEVALDIARSFKGDGGEPILYLLPALERIEVRSAAGEDDLYVSICDAFGPLVAARQRAGRPIRLSWTFWRKSCTQKWLVR